MAVTVNSLIKMKQIGEKVTMLTCYDASFAHLMDEAGVEILLVGDSLGMVVQGQVSTLPVSTEDMIYHTKSVSRGVKNAMIVVDLPFGSYQMSQEQAYSTAARIMEAGAHMVKIEGGAWLAETTEFLQKRAIPVCAHIGLTPQSVHVFGGYKVQGKTELAAQQLKEDAVAHENAGASLVVMECVPSRLAMQITQSLSIPTIGIGAGVDCDGQVLVMHDMLGVFPGKAARFVKNFMQGKSSIHEAVTAYVQEVKAQTFPAIEHCFD